MRTFLTTQRNIIATVTLFAALVVRVRLSRRPALKLLGTLLLVLSLLLPGAAPTLAVGQLDQQQTTQTSFFLIGAQGPGRSNYIQTFTAGLTGNLDQVSLPLVGPERFATFTVDILSVAGGVPTFTVLTTVTTQPTENLPLSGLPYPFTAFPLDPPLPVVAGTQYAIRVSTAGATDVIVLWR